jgi:polyhydroxyalkanoate synthase
MDDGMPATQPHLERHDDAARRIPDAAQSFDRSIPAVQMTTALDRLLHASQARLTGSISPAVLALAYADWLLHLANAPGKRTRLVEDYYRSWLSFCDYAMRQIGGNSFPVVAPSPQDHRFNGDAWRQPPFNLLQQGFLVLEDWWRHATTNIPGVDARHREIVAFTTRQLLDACAPSNSILSNPEVLAATLQRGGYNLALGAANLIDDARRALRGEPPSGAENFRPGVELAATPGKVVLRNELIELIQYAPSTPEVHAEPILIVPAWIMKYYILDLSPANSLVKYLVDAGHTVFMISWRNPGPEQCDMGMEDYRRLGIMAAMAAISAIVPDRKIHAAGYCLGGTLLTIAAAALARNGDERLASVTLMAAQTDFTEAGEIMIFTTEGQVAFLEDMMWERGYLDTSQMAGAFQLLRSNDLIWSKMVKQYLMGERAPLNDLAAWNADATRMPYRMHSEYLRKLFLANALAEGRYEVDGRPIALADIRAPIFAVGTETDHVAPWRSVYKIRLMTRGDVTFVLTNGGHNAGIVSEPGHRGRRFHIGNHSGADRFIDPDRWIEAAEARDGSWWPAWIDWLGRIAAPDMTPPPAMGAPAHGYPPIADAPGAYVLAS